MAIKFIMQLDKPSHLFYKDLLLFIFDFIANILIKPSGVKCSVFLIKLKKLIKLIKLKKLIKLIKLI
jgi:hypothetical protein